MFINPRYSVFSLLFLASFSFARDSNESGVELEPSAFFGTLENGFRYASVNSGPKDECIVYLHADVGSLNEEADESGMAHFLEHMAFRGGKHFGPGQMVKTLQMMGMTVGPHLNATTSFTETIYQFELKKCTKSNLREVLYAARDISDGLLLLDADIESEKGPVDAEERLRASPVQERVLQDLSRAFTGSMLAEHYPIGIKSIRDTFTAQKVRRFYEKWYRPDSLKLVVVGGLFNLNNFVDKAMPEFFGDMKPGPVTERKQVQLDTIQPVFAAHKVETLPVSVVSSSRYLPQRLCMQDSLAIDKRTNLLAIARVLEQRLNEKTEEWGARDIKVVLTDQSLVHSGQEATSILLPALGLGCIVVSDPHQAKFAFDHVEKEIAQMIAGGISHKEFEAAIRDQKEAAPKYDQKYIAEALLNQARALRPFENMEVAKHNYLRTLNAFTEKEATKMLAEIWYGTPVISAIQPSDELSETYLSAIFV